VSAARSRSRPGSSRSAVTPAAAFAFLLSAPAINPVVLVSTAVAFPDRPMMVLARLSASLVASIAMGLLWIARGRDDLLSARRLPVDEEAGARPVSSPRLSTTSCRRAAFW